MRASLERFLKIVSTCLCSNGRTTGAHDYTAHMEMLLALDMAAQGITVKKATNFYPDTMLNLSTFQIIRKGWMKWYCYASLVYPNLSKE